MSDVPGGDRSGLEEIWSILPAFRAIAETEHLPTAATRLGVTPSALSRALKRLEDQLGYTVFDRVGRGLRLNNHGRRLLHGLRAGVRELETALRSSDTSGGPLHIVCSTAVIPVLLRPAVVELRERMPSVVPHLHTPGRSDDANRALVDGKLDLALLEHPRPHDELAITRLIDMDYGVYAGPGHPLWERSDVSVAEVLRYPFVGPTVEEADRFPPQLRRNVALRVSQMGVAIGFCHAGLYLTVLPHALALRTPEALWRVPGFDVPSGALHLVYRVRSESAAPGQELLIQLLLEEAARWRREGDEP
ncbi:MAG: LysR family transcriptional regulator [Myxococcota bacterium]